MNGDGRISFADAFWHYRWIHVLGDQRFRPVEGAGGPATQENLFDSVLRDSLDCEDSRRGAPLFIFHEYLRRQTGSTMPHFLEPWPGVTEFDESPAPPRDSRVLVEVIGGVQDLIPARGTIRVRLTSLESTEGFSVILRANGVDLRPPDYPLQSEPEGLVTSSGYYLMSEGLFVVHTWLSRGFEALPPGEHEWIVPVEFARGTEPGAYTLEVIEAEAVTSTPEVIGPEVAGGTLEIRDPVRDLGHLPFPRLEFDVARRRIGGEFEVRTTSAEGFPGEQIVVWLEVRARRPVNRVNFKLQFPASAFELNDVVPVYTDPVSGEVDADAYWFASGTNGGTTSLSSWYNGRRGAVYDTNRRSPSLSYIAPMGEWTEFFEFRMTILEGARGRGEIPLRLLDHPYYQPGYEPYFDCTPTEMAWEYEPTIYSPGVITILGDGEPPPPPEPPLDPRDAEIRYTVGDARGDPGDVVRVPVTFESAVELYQVRPVLGYDATRLELEGFEVPFIDPAGDPAAPELLMPVLEGGAFSNLECPAEGEGDACLAGLPVVGFLRREPPDGLPPGHLIVDLLTTYAFGEGTFYPGPLSWEPGVEHLLGTALFRIREDAPLGRVPIEGVSVEWLPENEVEPIVSESSGHPNLDFTPERPDVPALEVVSGSVTIGPPEREFIRGDADLGGTVELTDAVYTLNHLFLRGPALSCEDAGDANDDGALDLTDGIYTLTHLFLVGPSPAPPYPEAGPDPTPDELNCAAGKAG